MTREVLETEDRTLEAGPASRRRIELSAAQWTILIVMGGILLAVGGVLLWVLRAGMLGEPVDVLATVVAGPTPTSALSSLVLDAIPTPSNLYWPSAAQSLATPNAPSDLLWWDARFAYRRQILFDVVSARSPAGVWARVIFDGESAQREGKMRTDGADLRILVWDGLHWWELPQSATPRREKRGWNVLFQIQATKVVQHGYYYLYYGNPSATPSIRAEGAPESSRLLLDLGKEEGVEWGPEVTWRANSATVQTLVSADGRIVIECPVGGPSRDVRVRLRTVPADEKNNYGPLPDFELHTEPRPGPPSHNNIAYWEPPLTVTINWVGLPVGPRDLESWTRFVYDEEADSWYNLPVEIDLERGLIRLVADRF